MTDGINTPLYWTVVQVNDGAPDAFGTFASNINAELALIRLMADVLDKPIIEQLEEMNEECTRTVHPTGAITWDDGDCWQAFIVPVWR